MFDLILERLGSRMVKMPPKNHLKKQNKKHLILVSKHSLLVQIIVAEMMRNEDTHAADDPKSGYCYDHVYMDMNNQISHVPFKHHTQNTRYMTSSAKVGEVKILTVID